MKNKKVAILTLGCKVNQYESNAIVAKFLEAGYQIIEKFAEADICVINTCSVTNISDRKSRQSIRKIRESNKNAIIVVTGCYAQVAKDTIAKMTEVNLVIGNNEKKDIVKYVEQMQNNYSMHSNENKIIEVQDTFKPKEFSDFGITIHNEKARASIKVQDGCDRFCSYCIIPYARGRVRSRKPESIISEIEDIVQKGIKEVIITGIHIASYGKDFKDNLYGYKLIDLLEEINNINGIERIRLGSIEPTLITNDFLLRLVKLNKICHHFHLSLQSGCDETLKRMNRQYSINEFSEVVKKLRDTYEDVVLTTDIIVGFPGETKEEFEKTYNFLSQIKFYKMHVFPYSARKGTKAAEMENQIDGTEKEKRSKILIELSNKNELEYNKLYIGKVVEILVEEDKKGHTGNYILVKVHENDKKCNIIENEIVKCKIVNVNQQFLDGIIIN